MLLNVPCFIFSFCLRFFTDTATNAAEKYLFVLGNLPAKYTKEDVVNLISETNPLHVGKIDSTPELNL